MEHWTKPPPEDKRLYDYFTGNGLAPPSTHSAFVALSVVGIAVRGQPDPDGRLINSGKVGFRQRDELELLERGNEDSGRRKYERVSAAQKHRETRALLEQLSAVDLKVLQLAFGPQDQIPEMAAANNAQVRAKLEGEAEVKPSARSKALGSYRQVLPMTEAAKKAFTATADGRERHLSVPHYLTCIAPANVISAARAEAYAMVRDAWNRWADLRGRRKLIKRHFVFLPEATA